MKVVILAGGMGSRFAEETDVTPKPMIEIGGQPILWHIMRHYALYGYREFIIALGYKAGYIKSYFADYYRQTGDLHLEARTGSVQVGPSHDDDWVVDLIDTGLDTQTGGRVKRLEPLPNGEPFLLTYADGLTNLPIDALVRFHKEQNVLATLTAVRPPARFGSLEIRGDKVTTFGERPEGWINGGFMVLEPEVLNYLEHDSSSFENVALVPLAQRNELAAYRHDGFWMCMDTLRDKNILNRLWRDGDAPWKQIP